MDWLPGVEHVDLRPKGNGPFGGRFLGVVVHVNVSGYTGDGTSVEFFRDNPAGVTPNFQVYRSGRIVQFLPIDWRPWCQMAGNDTYAAIECGGMPDQPYTAEQAAGIATILRAYHDEMGLPYRLANVPGQRGVGTHAMGGGAWGGHDCPGALRSAARPQLIALAQGGAQPEEADMTPAESAMLKDVWTALAEGRVDDLPNMLIHGDAKHKSSLDAVMDRLDAIESRLPAAYAAPAKAEPVKATTTKGSK